MLRRCQRWAFTHFFDSGKRMGQFFYGSNSKRRHQGSLFLALGTLKWESLGFSRWSCSIRSLKRLPRQPGHRGMKVTHPGGRGSPPGSANRPRPEKRSLPARQGTGPLLVSRRGLPVAPRPEVGSGAGRGRGRGRGSSALPHRPPPRLLPAPALRSRAACARRRSPACAALGAAPRPGREGGRSRGAIPAARPHRPRPEPARQRAPRGRQVSMIAPRVGARPREGSSRRCGACPRAPLGTEGEERRAAPPAPLGAQPDPLLAARAGASEPGGEGR